MERFTKWADKASGIAPFVPQGHTLPKNIVLRAGVIVAGASLACVRFVLLTIVAILLAASLLVVEPAVLLVVATAATAFSTTWSAGLFTVLCASIICAVPSLARALRALLSDFWFRMAFLILGVRVEERRRNHVKDRISAFRPRGGTLLICNHTSFLEVLYLSWKFGPVFAALDGEKPPNVGSEHLPAALWRAVRPPLSVPVSKRATCLGAVIDAAARRDASVVLFPEVARTNNDGILEWPAVFENFGDSKELKQVAVVVFSYSLGAARNLKKGKGFLPVHPVGSLARQLFGICSQPWRTTMLVQIIESGSLQPLPFGPNLNSASAKAQKVGSWVVALRALVASVAGKRCLALDCHDAQSFAAYWEARRRGDKDGAAHIASQRSKH